MNRLKTSSTGEVRGPSPKRLLLLVGRFAIAGAVLFYLFSSGSLDWVELGRLAESWEATALAVGLLAGLMVVASYRLCLLFGPLEFDLKLSASIRLTLIGTFFNSFMPGGGGGDLVRIYYATSGNEGGRTEVVAILLLDRLVGLTALLLVPPILAPFIWPILIAAPTVATLVALSTLAGLGGVTVLLILIWRPDFAMRLLGVLSRRLKFIEHFERSVLVLQGYAAAGRTLLAGFVVALIGHVLGVGALLVLAAGATGVPPTVQVAAMAPLGFVANALPLTPGGIGVGEAAMDALFAMAGHEGGAAGMLGWRLSMMLIGLAGLGVYLIGRRRFVTRTEATT